MDKERDDNKETFWKFIKPIKGRLLAYLMFAVFFMIITVLLSKSEDAIKKSAKQNEEAKATIGSTTGKEISGHISFDGIEKKCGMESFIYKGKEFPTEIQIKSTIKPIFSNLLHIVDKQKRNDMEKAWRVFFSEADSFNQSLITVTVVNTENGYWVAMVDSRENRSLSLKKCDNYYGINLK